MFTDEPTTSAPACRVSVKVVPGARRSEVVGRLGDRLKVRVAAPPEDGKANRAVCELLAAAVGCRAADVSVIAGHANPEKVLLVRGRTAAELAALWP